MLLLIQRIKGIKHLLAVRTNLNIKRGLHKTETTVNQQNSLIFQLFLFKICSPVACRKAISNEIKWYHFGFLAA